MPTKNNLSGQKRKRTIIGIRRRSEKRTIAISRLVSQTNVKRYEEGWWHRQKQQVQGKVGIDKKREIARAEADQEGLRESVDGWDGNKDGLRNQKIIPVVRNRRKAGGLKDAGNTWLGQACVFATYGGWKGRKKRTESADAAGPGQELIIISHPPRMYLPSKLGNIQFWETGTCTKIHKKLKSTS